MKISENVKLTASIIRANKNEGGNFTITDNAEVKKSDTAQTLRIHTDLFNMKGNSSCTADYIYCDEISMSGNSQAFTHHVGENMDSIKLLEESSLIIEADKERHEGYGENRGIERITSIAIDDSAQLTVKSYYDDAIYVYPYFGRITVSGNGILKVIGTSDNMFGINIGNSAFGSLIINDEASVIIEECIIGVMAQLIEINGGTLSVKCHKTGIAVIVDQIVSEYADFNPGFFINGEIVSQSCEGYTFGEYADIVYDVMQKDGDPLSSYSVTVKSQTIE